MAEEDRLWYQLLKDSVVMDEERESEVLIFLYTPITQKTFWSFHV